MDKALLNEARLAKKVAQPERPVSVRYMFVVDITVSQPIASLLAAGFDLSKWP
jgi:hypothetical protein